MACMMTGWTLRSVLRRSSHASPSSVRQYSSNALDFARVDDHAEAAPNTPSNSAGLETAFPKTAVRFGQACNSVTAPPRTASSALLGLTPR